MQVKVLSALGDNYQYLILVGNTAVAVDPGESASLLSLVGSLDVELSMVLLTHHHADHTAGCREIRSATGCVVIGPDDPRLPFLDRVVRGGDVVSAGECDIRVMAVPGHTRSHVAYYSPVQGKLWTGDTLFAGGCGRVFEGAPAEMWNSLRMLRDLPDETLVYCGHDYTLDNLEFAAHLEPDNLDVAERLADTMRLVRKGQPTVPSTLGLEKATNPFLRADTEAICRAIGMEGADPARVFGALRLRKDRW